MAFLDLFQGMTSASRIENFDCRASGLIALDKNVKVQKGSICGLSRDRDNVHGTFILFMRPPHLSQQIYVVISS